MNQCNRHGDVTVTWKGGPKCPMCLLEEEMHRLMERLAWLDKRAIPVPPRDDEFSCGV